MTDVYKFNPDEILSPDEEVIHEQNKMIERLQEQLKECEEALVEAYDDCYNEGFEPDLAKEYLKKWGVNDGLN